MLFLKILLLFHILGDFYFQSNKLSKLKKDKILFLIIHVVIYMLLFIPLFWINENTLAVSFIIIGIFITHLVCDYVMSKISKGNKSLKLLLIDQTIHILTISIVWFILKETVIEFTNINDYLNQIEILVSVDRIISIALILLIIGRPTSIIVEKMLPVEIKEETTAPDLIEQTPKINYGSLIGILERVIIVLLAILNLWSSIALVFTAKSIARFKQLENKNFAQKYLIGTLLSLSITLGILLLFL